MVCAAPRPSHTPKTGPHMINASEAALNTEKLMNYIKMPYKVNIKSLTDVLCLCKAYDEVKSMQDLLEASTIIIFERWVLELHKERYHSCTKETGIFSLNLLQLGTPHESTSFQRCPCRGWRAEAPGGDS